MTSFALLLPNYIEGFSEQKFCIVTCLFTDTNKYRQTHITNKSQAFISTMSDFIRRASDAFHRRTSTDSTDAPTSPDPPSAAKPPEQESQNQKPESTQPQSHVNEAFAGVANGKISLSRLLRLLYNNNII